MLFNAVTQFSHIVGTRPNLIKLAALYPHLPAPIFHTGQHSGSMSDPFFEQYSLPTPHPLSELSGDIAVVFGDCRATLEGAAAAQALGMRIAHVEAGLRCGDLEMIEERIRIKVDSMSDWLFAPSQDAVDNLKSEGVRGQIHLVGNVVIDTLVQDRYGLLTLHRPFNVDDKDRLVEILLAVADAGIDTGMRFVWPTHPRYHNGELGIGRDPDLMVVKTVPPQPRREFIKLLQAATVVVTDSGGVQEEAAFFGVPCVTVRPSTERPITLRYGNRLADAATLTSEIKRAVPMIPLWDGKAAERIAKILLDEKISLR